MQLSRLVSHYHSDYAAVLILRLCYCAAKQTMLQCSLQDYAAVLLTTLFLLTTDSIAVLPAGLWCKLPVIPAIRCCSITSLIMLQCYQLDYAAILSARQCYCVTNQTMQQCWLTGNAALLPHRLCCSVTSKTVLQCYQAKNAAYYVAVLPFTLCCSVINKTILQCHQLNHAAV